MNYFNKEDNIKIDKIMHSDNLSRIPAEQVYLDNIADTIMKSMDDTTIDNFKEAQQRFLDVDCHSKFFMLSKVEQYNIINNLFKSIAYTTHYHYGDNNNILIKQFEKIIKSLKNNNIDYAFVINCYMDKFDELINNPVNKIKNKDYKKIIATYYNLIQYSMEYIITDITNDYNDSMSNYFDVCAGLIGDMAMNETISTTDYQDIILSYNSEFSPDNLLDSRLYQNVFQKLKFWTKYEKYVENVEKSGLDIPPVADYIKEHNIQSLDTRVNNNLFDNMFYLDENIDFDSHYSNGPIA